jgi:hypothetical protein
MNKTRQHHWNGPQMSDGIIIAIIGGGFTIIATLIEVTRRQNNRDHGENSRKLDYLADLFRDHLKGHK